LSVAVPASVALRELHADVCLHGDVDAELRVVMPRRSRRRAAAGGLFLARDPGAPEVMVACLVVSSADDDGVEVAYELVPVEPEVEVVDVVL